MLFTPNYTVSYNGVFHKAGVPFDIDPKDRDEMARHGRVEEESPATQPGAPGAEADETNETAQPARKGGRPRKVSA